MRNLILKRIMKAYSLIELMVVVAIIAVIAAIGIPSYKKYYYTARIEQAVIILNNMTDKAIGDYTKALIGKAGVPFTYSGVQFGIGNNTNSSITQNTLNISPVITAGYWTPDLLTAPANTIFVICVYVGGLTGMVSDYQTPVPGVNLGQGQRAALCTAVIESNSVFKRLCGSYSSSIYDIPYQFSPSGCNCASIYNNAC